ncbi:amine oxidase [Rivularia sp. IAM M-261]|nr:amine oxidase [Rivularia sp. IAM M-261]
MNHEQSKATMSIASHHKKVVVVGAGWAGLGATYHLAKQGYDVTLLEAGAYPGGLVAGWKTPGGRSVEAGIHGFWYPYRNIFSLTNELEINPFTHWTRSSQYSPNGLEVESPIFQDLPRLPTPLGTFVYTQFKRLPLIDRISALPLLYAVVDFDNSDEAWRRYDSVTARELFKQFGVSGRLYRESFEPMLLVGLFAPGEQCSAAATLGMLYYFILAHQPDFDVVWCRGTVGEKIFRPWVEHIEQLGGKVLANRRVTDVITENNKATGVVCGDEVFDADAVIFSVGITGMKKIVANSPTLQTRSEFRNLTNLGAVDVVAVRLWFDRKINIPLPSNACFGFDETTGWTFFDLNALHDEYRDEPGTVVEVDFYHANQFIPLNDEEIIPIVQKYLQSCVPAFGGAKVIDSSVIRLPQAVSHFAPGSYRHMLPATTSFSNIFMSGDWIITRHGSWSQEKAYVTGLEAANLVISQLGEGTYANVLPIEQDEAHIQTLRQVNRNWRQFSKSILPDFWLP